VRRVRRARLWITSPGRRKRRAVRAARLTPRARA
jgi:hypothetical protein